jgi:hypothetical protein
MPFARPSLVAATLTALACSGGERQSNESADRVFTPRQYSVADLYRNTTYLGASFSPTADRIRYSSDRAGNELNHLYVTAARRI